VAIVPTARGRHSERFADAAAKRIAAPGDKRDDWVASPFLWPIYDIQ